MTVQPPSTTSLIRVSKESPCPICGKPDWCSFFQNGLYVICMRKQDGSIKITRNGGYLHLLSGTNKSVIRKIPMRAKKKNRTDLQELADYYCEQGRKHFHRIQWLTKKLQLPVKTLISLKVGWSENRMAFTFPMRNAISQIIGIRLRRIDGSKYAVTGSKNGLFIPCNLSKPSRVFFCEGPTDCAALLSLGFPSIGLPSCTGGVNYTVEWVRRNHPKLVIVVSDIDKPGKIGAKSLAAALCTYTPSVKIIQPPDTIKDARAWVNSGATLDDIDMAIRRTKRVHSFRRGISI